MPSRLSSSGIFAHRRQLVGLPIRHQRVDQLVEGRPLQNLIQLVQGQSDAMIGDTALWKVIGADALRSITGADLILALGGPHIGGLLALLFEQSRAQHLHGKPAVLMLRFLGGYHHKPRSADA